MMANPDPNLATLIAVLNDALQVAVLLVEVDPGLQPGANADKIQDAVCRAATAARDLRLMIHTDSGRHHLVRASGVGAGVALGAALGGILNGAKGAFTGAAIGAGGATVYQWATHEKDSTAELMPQIEFALSDAG